MLKRVSSLVLSAALLLACVYMGAPSVTAVEVTTAQSTLAELSYADYLERHADYGATGETLTLDATLNFVSDRELEIAEIDGKRFVITEDEGYIEWKFTVNKAGLYRISAVWMSAGGKGLDIIRTVSVDGNIPFDGLNSVYFRRSWENTGEVYFDSSDNEYSQKLKEKSRVLSSQFYSLTDYYAGGYALALDAGEHTLRFTSIQEPMAINSIVLSDFVATKSYKQVKKEYDQKGYKAVTADVSPIIIEAEEARFSSKSTLRPQADRSSPAVYPYDTFKKKLNTIGGAGWSEAAGWIEWDFKVEKSGLYQVMLHAKQDYKSGFASSRRLLIDGVSPFDEADHIETQYGLNWQNVILSNEDGVCLVYLDEGEHTLQLEVSVTREMSNILNRSLVLQNELIALYRQIIMVTGTIPDTLRDYNLFSNITDCEKRLKKMLSQLEALVSELEKLGYSGAETADMNRLIIQLEDFIEDDNSIPERLNSFNNNIMSFSTWITSAMQQPLLLDRIIFMSSEAEAPKADCGFFKKLADECIRLLSSFVNDYDVMKANGGKDNKSVTLWVGLGIDQAIVLKSLIDSSFTAKSDINVNIELVNMGVLLRAVAANVGPDVALFQAQNTPVEYAMRGAVYDLKNFDDIDKVLERFYPSAYGSFEYEGGLYALPETQTFSMLFYRNDILDDLGIAVPNTWNELYAALAKLQTNNLSISVPTPFSGGSGSLGLNSVYMMLLYQNGGSLYTPDGKRTLINEENAISAFTQWVNLYTKYKIPQTTNILTRFRMGESPLVISEYTFYNQLQIGAPEIEGKWDIAPVPATVRADGTLDRTQASNVTSCLIFSNSKDKQSSWEFIKWWTDADTQTDYGIEIEALQGASARWATANTEAFKGLPWASRISRIIEQQWENVRSVPQVAGGYYTARSIDNAIRSVVNENENTRETILDFATEIDEEITVKRKEFNLSTEE